MIEPLHGTHPHTTCFSAKFFATTSLLCISQTIKTLPWLSRWMPRHVHRSWPSWPLKLTQANSAAPVNSVKPRPPSLVFHMFFSKSCFTRAPQMRQRSNWWSSPPPAFTYDEHIRTCYKQHWQGSHLAWGKNGSEDRKILRKSKCSSLPPIFTCDEHPLPPPLEHWHQLQTNCWKEVISSIRKEWVENQNLLGSKSYCSSAPLMFTCDEHPLRLTLDKPSSEEGQFVTLSIWGRTRYGMTNCTIAMVRSSW